MQISLVIPILNEEQSIDMLLESIENQNRMPDEVVLVDGGSTDRTIEIVENLISQNREKGLYKLVKAGKATPGRGRNLGLLNSSYDFIAFTDAGIKLDPNWLQKLVEAYEANPDLGIIYGNCNPKVETFFERCAMFAYVSPRHLFNGRWVRGPFIASSLVKRSVWKEVGGFPDMRAAEDLIFMDAVAADYQVGYAPDANVLWELRPDLSSTFKKFILYSKNNVWVNRQWDWHYGILKQYLIILPFILLSILHSWKWLGVIVIWTIVRTSKRILGHRDELGIKPLFNPLIFFSVMVLIFVIDIATFIGWIQAKIEKQPTPQHGINEQQL